MAQLNGTPISPADLQVLALTNYGHFTSMRVDDGRARGLSLHLERLVRDCRAVFDADLDREHVRELVRRAVGDQDSGTSVVRVTVFDPGLQMGNPGADADPQVLVTHRPINAEPLPPLTVTTVPFQRDLPEVKHIGLFGQLHCRRAAQRAGADDALFTDPGTGRISEGGTWNVGFVARDGRVVWPEARVLPGVTMRLLQEAHPSSTEPVTEADLPSMRAAFATNTSIGVRPISGIGDLALSGDDPVLEDLCRAYAAIEATPI
jgi:branched-subunit amino acid aminotransferase/4-amino-4-deoxychorismate lyase